MTIEDYLLMTDEELAEFNLTDEILAEIHLEKGIEHFTAALEMAERCYKKFGVQLLSDAQKAIYKRVVKNRVCPTDEEMDILTDEQITSDMKAVKAQRELESKRAEDLGEAYTPELVFQDKTASSVS